MPEIEVLSPHVADLIAAGEVVERPASVVKELMENSFDAGARNVTVEIRSGGATYIRVTDDGCGMASEDAGVAFLRHATSKLRDEEGLTAISTMGFRGEALAAISAVSHIELTTRRKGTSEGTRVLLDAGDITDMLPTGCPEGTTMVVRDLFYNTPARLKFLKSDRSEASACQLTALRCALGRPEVSVRFIKDGEELFFSPGDGREDSAVYALLGRDAASQLLRCTGENGGVTVTGYASSPAAGHGNRREQYFFCNGRFIKSQLLQAALEQAYKNTLLVGRYPACVLYLDISCAQVDVNVHPAKVEVKFSDEKKVFDAVHYAVLSALRGEDRTAGVELSASTRRVTGRGSAEAPRQKVEPKQDFYRSMSAEDFRANNYGVRPSVSAGKTERAGTPVVRPPAAVRRTAMPPRDTLRERETAYQTSIDLTPPRAAPERAEKSLQIPAVAPSADSRTVENPVQNVETLRVPDHKIVGEALKTYIIVETGDQLLLIDKHAAHERMNFDRLKAQEHEIMAQTLLTAVTWRPSGEDAEILEKNAALLAELGFEIEAFGVGDYIVRAVPADIDIADIVPALEEICEKLRRGRDLDPQSARDEILHTVACKAAIKAGWDTSVQELETIAVEVLSGRVKYCPHGRPVSMVVTRRDLDKLFKRIV